MRLYSGTSEQFVEDTIQNQIAEKLRLAFFQYYGHSPSPSEVNSWRNSLRAVCQVVQHSNLIDHGILLEYELPLSSKRLDCIVTGRDGGNRDNAVIIELKQWDKCESASGDNEVMTWLGGGKREVLHPSVQVYNYKIYLQDAHTAFCEDPSPVLLNACTYLHNYNRYSNDILFSEKYQRIMSECPLFTADDVNKLKGYLVQRLENGNGIEALKRIERSKYRPSKKLLNFVGKVIKGMPAYTLLDEQLVVYDKVFSLTREGFHDKQKTVIIVKGGPGTGKSVIAINLMADLSLKKYNAHYATGSRAFTETLRKIIGPYGSSQFKYFNSYTGAEPNVIDVLIADEAHRIRSTSNSRFTPKQIKSEMSQIEELINAAKIAVFFLDDDQVVRPGEIGSAQYIRDYATKLGCQIHEYELETQFRCKGSEGFINWVNNTLGIKRTANALWGQDSEFEFRIFEGPDELETAIRKKVDGGDSARLVAGFCWPWSTPNPDGTLKNDVKIGPFERPWNAKPEARRLAAGIPKASIWAHDPNGINQIGCVYTAQGFEFDYVGVIFGDDLRYSFKNQDWEGCPDRCADNVVNRSKKDFTKFVKNTYRVLLTRGMKGCYVCFLDEDTEKFFRSRIEKNRPNNNPSA